MNDSFFQRVFSFSLGNKFGKYLCRHYYGCKYTLLVIIIVTSHLPVASCHGKMSSSATRTLLIRNSGAHTFRNPPRRRQVTVTVTNTSPLGTSPRHVHEPLTRFPVSPSLSFRTRDTATQPAIHQALFRRFAEHLNEYCSLRLCVSVCVKPEVM